MADLVSLNEKMGLECTGVITNLGNTVCNLRKGDRVMAIGPGCHRTSVIRSENLCQRIHLDKFFRETSLYDLAHRRNPYLGIRQPRAIKKSHAVDRR